MRFMFKMVIWGFIGLMILPSLVETPDSGAVDQSEQVSNASASAPNQFSTTDAMHMAVGFAGYLKNVCTHDAALCESGGRLVEAALVRAKKGVVVVAGMVETHRAENREASDPTTTSSIK